MTSIARTSLLSLMLVLCLVNVPIHTTNLGHVRFTNYAALPNMVARSINMAVMDLGKMKQLERQHHITGNNRMMHSYHMAHAGLFNDATAVAALNDKSYITGRATKELARLTNTPYHLLQTDPNVVLEWRRQIAPHCNMPLLRCNLNYAYRTADGTCNNLHNPTWGAAMRPHLRYLPAAYEDGINIPRQLSVTGGYLHSPRVISNVLHSTGTSDLDEGGRSVLMMSWGTLIVFDLIKTPVSTGPNNTDITCCPSAGTTPGSCFPIEIPRGDPRFTSNCMNFVRSAMAPSPLCDMGVRNQINEHTSYIDASMVYGSSQQTQNRLRAGHGGFLKMGPNGFLPPADDSTCTLSAPGEFCFDAGDSKNTLLPSLAALYTVLVREHNRIAKQVQIYNPSWSDEKVFQETRKIVSAIIQHINYNEYLPHVISDADMQVHGLYSTPKGHHTVYNPNVNPTIANVFGAAAFRSGHSSVPNTQGIKDPQTHQSIEVKTESTYFRPALLFAGNGRGADWLNFWQLNSKQARQDRFLQDALRNELLVNEMGVGLDLAAVNIQRGRDHGLPSYNAWRKWCGLQPAHHFGVNTLGLIHHDAPAAILLSKVYKHPDDIDLFTGALSERKIRGTYIGPTFSCIIAKQFQLLKQGDRFWYENDIPNIGLTAAQLNEIKKVRLSQIMCRNIGISQIQLNAFRVPSLHNPLVRCDTLPTIDLRHWIGSPRTHLQSFRLNTGFLLNRSPTVPNNPVTLWSVSSRPYQTIWRSLLTYHNINPSC
ncbi:lactoperoxidase-like [Pecten maximus]|uniref:lactoperoxidase-like n=1 Tax=Pecten maximus TaxID=6579 RepID=UPI0014583EB9|nr:lactoperoxidase-like [Pecten maximus]